MAGATLRDGKGKFETPARVVKNADDGGAAGDRLTRSLVVAGALQSVLAARKAADCSPPCGGRPGRRWTQSPESDRRERDRLPLGHATGGKRVPRIHGARSANFQG